MRAFMKHSQKLLMVLPGKIAKNTTDYLMMNYFVNKPPKLLLFFRGFDNLLNLFIDLSQLNQMIVENFCHVCVNATPGILTSLYSTGPSGTSFFGSSTKKITTGPFL